MAITSRELLLMPRAKLDDLYRQSSPGPLPAGDSKGTALIWSGTWVAHPIAWIVNRLFWQGKIFNRTNDTLVNKLSPIGIHAVKAIVYKGSSWMDGHESIILDYSRTSLVAWYVRDEIREITPGLYLGQAYLGRVRFIRFAIAFILSIPKPTCDSSGSGPPLPRD
jgi:hypothetical protein